MSVALQGVGHLVFIGRTLDAQSMRQEFAACLI